MINRESETSLLLPSCSSLAERAVLHIVIIRCTNECVIDPCINSPIPCLIRFDRVHIHSIADESDSGASIRCTRGIFADHFPRVPIVASDEKGMNDIDGIPTCVGVLRGDRRGERKE